MKIFTPMYNWTLKQAKKKYAEKFLYFIATIESIFFPIPTDIVLAPLVLANPKKTLRYAFLTSLFSSFGGIVGFYLGYFFFDLIIEPHIFSLGLKESFDTALIWFNKWGIWVVFIAGFSPIPYKVFAIGAGFLQMPVIAFFITSLIARSLRFFLVAYLIKFGGKKLESNLKKYIDIIGWILILIIAALYFYIK